MDSSPEDLQASLRQGYRAFSQAHHRCLRAINALSSAAREIDKKAEGSDWQLEKSDRIEGVRLVQMSSQLTRTLVREALTRFLFPDEEAMGFFFSGTEPSDQSQFLQFMQSGAEEALQTRDALGEILNNFSSFQNPSFNRPRFHLERAIPFFQEAEAAMTRALLSLQTEPSSTGPPGATSEPESAPERPPTKTKRWRLVIWLRQHRFVLDRLQETLRETPRDIGQLLQNLRSLFRKRGK